MAMLAAMPSVPGDCIDTEATEAAGESGPLAISVDVREGVPILRVTGRIEAGATERLRLALEDSAVDEIWFDSMGGDNEEAGRIGALLRRSGMIARVPAGAVCADACVTAFLGGIARMVDPGGRIGIAAMPLSDQNAPLSQAEREQAAGRWAERQADHYIRAGISRGLLRLQLNRPAGSLCWLTDEARQRYNVSNGIFAGRAPATPPAQPTR